MTSSSEAFPVLLNREVKTDFHVAERAIGSLTDSVNDVPLTGQISGDGTLVLAGRDVISLGLADNRRIVPES